ncbi:MAG: hypothetical protein K2G29_03320 [Muribaculaceae bacterium]|nr:hypothetical protein [Muribaculaceae bacterium]MDE6421885.1 hypothetical protein [Muribaculaceae bacterium]
MPYLSTAKIAKINDLTKLFLVNNLYNSLNLYLFQNPSTTSTIKRTSLFFMNVEISALS